MQFLNVTERGEFLPQRRTARINRSTDTLDAKRRQRGPCTGHVGYGGSQGDILGTHAAADTSCGLDNAAVIADTAVLRIDTGGQYRSRFFGRRQNLDRDIGHDTECSP